MGEVDQVQKLLIQANHCLEQERWLEAQQHSEAALAERPHDPAAWHLRGLAFHCLGDTLAAVLSLQRATELSPDDADIWNNFGNVLRHCGRMQEAMHAFQQAMRLRPKMVEAHNNLGFALYQQGEFYAAIQRFRQATKLAPNFTLAYNNMACALFELKQYDEAIAILRQAIEIDPLTADSYVNLGDALRRSDRHDEAIAVLQQGLSLNPQMPEALINLGGVYKDLGRRSEATSAYEKAIGIRRDYAYAHWNLALMRLAEGEFDEGWDDFEWRLKIPLLAPEIMPNSPRWNGEPLAGRIILLIAEQGLGDTLQFIRYASLLKQFDAQVVIAAQRPLLKLLKSCAGVDQVVPLEASFPAHHFHIPLLSLPRFFSPTIDSLPQNVPYLRAEEYLIVRWRERLADIRGLRVGIGWQGNPEYVLDRFRSVPLQHFEKIAAVPNVQLISLQKGSGLDQLPAMRERFSILDLGPKLDVTSGPFMDTAAVVSQLDLVISSDTALVHLAGALGVPVWMPTSFVPDWRWFLERTDSPWYPRMRLFRQQKLRDWDSVFDAIAVALAAHSQTRMNEC